jgi:hypothetical protein
MNTVPAAADYPPDEFSLSARMPLASVHGWWTPVDLVALVRLYRGMWIADCPRCWGNAERWDRDHGMWTTTNGQFEYHGGLSSTELRCSNCYAVTQAVWPTDRQTIWDICAERPVPGNRNWMPGQTLTDLRMENELECDVYQGVPV